MKRAKTDSDCDIDSDSEISAVLVTDSCRYWHRYRDRYRCRNRLLSALRRQFCTLAARMSESQRDTWRMLRLPHQLCYPPTSPHSSPAFYCGGGSGHVYCVALGRAPRRTVEYACGALGRAPCIHARLRRLATKPGEKCGLERKQIHINQ